MDWAVTNFVLDKIIGDGRYVYNNYPGAHRASATEKAFSPVHRHLLRGMCINTASTTLALNVKAITRFRSQAPQ
jgi:hypothetical protein